MLSGSEASRILTGYEDEILRLRLRMTLRDSFAAWGSMKEGQSAN
jgi:hypothetical protein